MVSSSFFVFHSLPRSICQMGSKPVVRRKFFCPGARFFCCSVAQPCRICYTAVSIPPILRNFQRNEGFFMSVMELLASRRTYRRFEQKAVPQDVVEDIIEALRLSSCGANRQAVRLVVVNRPEDVARVQPLVKWAAYLPPEQGTPKADELPTLYMAVVQDTSIPGDLATDTGIALANMTLAAWAKGVGSCIMGAINKPALTQLLGIEEPQKLAFMVAFGYPAHKAGIVPLTEQTGVKYYLDENRDYCVPKRSRDEIARYL
jgi:FMN reductase [NAD(P)H]